MRNVNLVLLMSLGLLLPVIARAEESATQPATQPSTPAADVVEVTDIETLKASVGKELTVRGKVSGTFVPKSGSVLLINFEGVNRDFVAVVPKASLEAVNAGFSGDVAAAVKDQTILVTGPIKLYREKPQIEILKPEQLKIQAQGEKKE